jgi:hypothetical protein
MAASHPSRWRFAAFQRKLKPLVQPFSHQAAGKCNLDSHSKSTACVRAGCAAVAAQVRTRQPSIDPLVSIASVRCAVEIAEAALNFADGMLEAGSTEEYAMPAEGLLS